MRAFKTGTTSEHDIRVMQQRTADMATFIFLCRNPRLPSRRALTLLYPPKFDPPRHAAWKTTCPCTTRQEQPETFVSVTWTTLQVPTILSFLRAVSALPSHRRWCCTPRLCYASRTRPAAPLLLCVTSGWSRPQDKRTIGA